MMQFRELLNKINIIYTPDTAKTIAYFLKRFLEEKKNGTKYKNIIVLENPKDELSLQFTEPLEDTVPIYLISLVNKVLITEKQIVKCL